MGTMPSRWARDKVAPIGPMAKDVSRVAVCHNHRARAAHDLYGLAVAFQMWGAAEDAEAVLALREKVLALDLPEKRLRSAHVAEMEAEISRLRSLIRAEHGAGAQNAAGACGCEVCRG